MYVLVRARGRSSTWTNVSPAMTTRVPSTPGWTRVASAPSAVPAVRPVMTPVAAAAGRSGSAATV